MRKEHQINSRRNSFVEEDENDETPELMKLEGVKNLNVMELLDHNSSFRKISAVQKRHLESLAEGPKYFAPNKRLWTSGSPVDNAFIVVEGTARFARSTTLNNGKVKVNKICSENSY